MFYAFTYAYSVGACYADTGEPIGTMRCFTNMRDRDKWVSLDPMLDSNCHRCAVDHKFARKYLLNFARCSTDVPNFVISEAFGEYSYNELLYCINHASMSELSRFYDLANPNMQYYL